MSTAPCTWASVCAATATTMPGLSMLPSLSLRAAVLCTACPSFPRKPISPRGLPRATRSWTTRCAFSGVSMTPTTVFGMRPAKQARCQRLEARDQLFVVRLAGGEAPGAHPLVDLLEALGLVHHVVRVAHEVAAHLVRRERAPGLLGDVVLVLAEIRHDAVGRLVDRVEIGVALLCAEVGRDNLGAAIEGDVHQVRAFLQPEADEGLHERQDR